VWAAVLVVQVGSWSAVHSVPLQGRDIAISLPPAAEWRAVHVLVDGCNCSRTVSSYLIARGPHCGWDEQVWVLGGAPFSAPNGFSQRHLSSSEAAERGLVGGPRLLLFSPSGRLVWSGGYGPARPRSSAQGLDLQIMSAARAGLPMAAVPVFGCARPTVVGSSKNAI
jgi:hypothetical protein